MEIDKEIILRFFDICPSLIALIIALLTPLINKKLDIEKNEVQFLFAKKYEIFTKHFEKLYEFRNALKNLIATLMCCYNEPDKVLVDILNNDIKELYFRWDEVHLSEASLWLFAEYKQLNKNSDLLVNVKHFYEKLNTLQNNNVLSISENDLTQLIKLGESIQIPISQILDYYRDKLNFQKQTFKEKITNLFRLK